MASQAEIDLIVNATRTLSDLDADLRRIVRLAEARAPAVNIDVDVDRGALSRITSALGPVASGLGSIATAGLAVGASVPLVAGLAVAIESILPAAAVAVPALLTVGLAAGTVKLAMVGVGDAIETAFDPEAKPEDLAEAMKRLAPEAQKFVKELTSMKKEFKELQLGVQNRFFRDFDAITRRLGQSVLPVLRGALNRSADSLNAMARGAAAAAVEMAESGVLGKALRHSTEALREMEGVPREVVQSLGFLGAAAGPALERIAEAASGVSTRIAESLARAFETGALETAIEQAIDAIAQLGRIGGNIMSGLGNIIGGVTQNGNGLFDVLEKLSEGFERLTASKEFQIILSELSKTADSLVKNVLPLLQEAFVQLAPVIEELGPPIRDFINEIGPELIPVLQELGPILVDIAEIIREQMPFAIEFTRAALEVLTLVFNVFHRVLEVLILPIVRKVAAVLNSEYVQAIATASRMTAGRIGEVLASFERFRQRVAEVIGAARERLASFVASAVTFASGVFRAVQEVIKTFTDMPGRIRDAVGNLGSLLFSAGADIIRGLINGIRSQMGRLASIAREAASTVADAVSGLLRIGSPSKLFDEFGVDTMEGYINGFLRMVPDLRSAVQSVGLGIPEFAGVNETRSAFPRIPEAQAPQVNVFLGNRLIDEHIDVRVETINRFRDRLTAQGMRR